MPILFLGLACVLAFALPSYFVFLAIGAVTTALIIQSIGILVARAGLISLCQMAFCGVGAWVALWLNVFAPWTPFLLQLVAGAAVAALVGLLIGLPALRLRGINLAAITLAFATAANIFFIRFRFPGEDILTPFSRPEWLSNDRHLLLFCLLALILSTMTLIFLKNRRVGAAWSIVGYSEKATAALGISVAGAKLSAFATSAAIAGLAGVLMAAQLGILTANNFAPLTSIVNFALAVVAGGALIEGAVAAGILSVAIPEIFRVVGLPLDLDALLFGAGAVDGMRRGISIGGGIRTLTLPPKLVRQAAAIEPEGDLAALKSRRRSSDPVDLPALDVRDLSVHFGEVRALDGVSMVVPPQSIVALIGPNGAGKSTLIDAVTGFVPSKRGTITSGDIDLSNLAPHRRAHVGVRRTFQQGRAVPDLTIRQYVRLAAGQSLSDRDLEAVLAYFDCPGPEMRIGDIEVGIRRLVEVAGNVAARPRLLLLDEPAAGLSSNESTRLGKKIAGIPAYFGCAVLLVEHDMDLVKSTCDRVTVLDFGKVIAEGTSGEVMAHPTVLAAYVGDVAA